MVSTELAAEELTKDGGVRKTVVTPGQAEHGHPLKGDTVFVHYVGTLKETGEKFDSSRDRNEPFKFTLGKGQVIKGWDIGVASMLKGEVADLECTADYAYGAKGSAPKIPGGATLVFNVELLSWEGEDISPDRDGTIMKSIVVKGEEHNCPAENAMVKVHAVGQCNGRTFYDKEVEFILGEGLDHQLPEGIDRAIRRVNKGEKCKVILNGNRFNYGSNAPEEFNLDVNAEVVFTVFLKDFEKMKSNWELTDAERLEKCQYAKDRGTNFLNQGKLQLALGKYNVVVSMLEHSKPQVPEEFGEKFDTMFLAGLLNCALVSLKMNETAECIKKCDKALEKNPDHVKALYRKAQAYEQRKDFEEAIQLYKKVHNIDPDNKASLQQVCVCKEKMVALNEKERKRFKGMFEKLSAKDTA